MTPVAARKENEARVLVNLYGVQTTEHAPEPKFKMGDKVRITKKMTTFEKGYTPRWTEEVFTISQVQYTNLITYKIVDSNDEEKQGTFYEPELQKTTQEIFRIEKIVRQKGYKYLEK
jgi:hypothetical protein